MCEGDIVLGMCDEGIKCEWVSRLRADLQKIA